MLKSCLHYDARQLKDLFAISIISIYTNDIMIATLYVGPFTPTLFGY